MEQKLGGFAAPNNPQELADEVKAVVLGGSTLIIFVLHHFGVNVGNLAITDFAVGAGTAASSLWVAYGLIKRFTTWAITSWNNRSTTPQA